MWQYYLYFILIIILFFLPWLRSSAETLHIIPWSDRTFTGLTLRGLIWKTPGSSCSLMICWISVWFILYHQEWDLQSKVHIILDHFALKLLLSACSAGIWEQKKLNHTLYFLLLFVQDAALHCGGAHSIRSKRKAPAGSFSRNLKVFLYKELFGRDLGLASWLLCVLDYC